ncbi:hypothetical protein JCM6882_006396 [Rhodosporidiobolus microsporus]
MVEVQQPPLPAVADYPVPCPFEDVVNEAHERFVRELNSPHDGWTEIAEKEGVQLSKKWDEGDANPIPLSKGETVVENVKPEAFLAGVIQLPGMRKLWDSRTEVGYMMQRFSPDTVLFYALTKGKRFLAKPRDMVGIQRNYAELDGTRMIIQTSVDTDVVPEQKGTTRATLKLSGWCFKPEGNNTRVIYILDVALNGRIPSVIVSMATSESPLCAAHARDVFYEYGHAPFVHIPPDQPQPNIVFQLESISDLPQREYRCTITTRAPGETFEIVYDLERMYKPEGGVQVQVEGEGAEAKDDGKGVVTVTTTEEGKNVTVVLTPK